MNPSRRAVLLASLATPPRLLAFGEAPALRLTVAESGRVRVLAAADDRRGLDLPAARARLVAHVSLCGSPAALIRFAADSVSAGTMPAATICDLLAVVGIGAAGACLVALEVLDWRRADGAHLSTRPRVAADGASLLLQRAAAQPMPGGLVWRREAWTDVLEGAPWETLRDCPARPPRAGSWQARLAGRRAEVRALLGKDRTRLSAALLQGAADAAPPSA